MNVAVVSLSPLSACGGSERFTLDCIQSIRACGDLCEAFAIRDRVPADGSRGGARPFVHTFDGRNERELPFRELLGLLRRFDVVWVHQYLGSELIFDIFDAVGPHIPLLLTNLGDEALLRVFGERYRGSANHLFLHPWGAFAAGGDPAATVMAAGVWADGFGSPGAAVRVPQQLCMLDGLSPQSGIETAVRALPERCSLLVTGALPEDAAFFGHLRRVMSGARVYFTGAVPETKRRAVLANSALLIAAHTPVLWDGSRRRVDPFVSTMLLEALSCDTLPLTSDLAPHVETMTALGLADLVFPAGDAGALRRLVERVLSMDADELEERKAVARARLRQSYLWDDFWLRVRRELHLGSTDDAPERAVAASAGLTLSTAGHGVSGGSFPWKVLSF